MNQMAPGSFADRFGKKLTARREFEATPNLVFQVKAYDKDSQTIVGTALTGEDKDQEVRVKISGEGGPRAPDFASFAFGKGTTPLSKSPVGAILTAQTPSKGGDGVYSSRWLSIVTKDPAKDPAVFGVMARIAVRKDGKGAPLVDDKGNYKFSVSAFDPMGEKQVKSVAEFKQTILDILGKEPLLPGGSQSVVVSLASPDYPKDGVAKRLPITRRSVKTGDGWQPESADKVVAAAIKEMGGETDLAEMLEAGAKVGVCAQTYVSILGKTAEKLTKEFKDSGTGRSIQMTEIGRSVKQEDGSRKFEGNGAYGSKAMNLTFTRVTNDEGQATGPIILTRAYNADNSYAVPMGAVPSTILSKEDIQTRIRAEAAAKREAAAKNGEAKENKAADPQKAAAEPEQKPLATSMADMEPNHDEMFANSDVDAMIAAEMDDPSGP